MKNENVDQGQKGIDLKKNVPSLNNDVCDCHTFENRCLFQNGAKNVLKLNLCFIQFNEIFYKIKTVICIKVKAVLHPSGKQCLYFSFKKLLINETMTVYAVKTLNDFKAKKMYLRITDVENCKYDFIKSLIPLCLSLDTK